MNAHDRSGDDGLRIRELRADDIGGWTPLWDGYNAFYGRSGATALPAATTELAWTRFLDPAVPQFALLACREERLVGLAHYLFHLSTTATTPACYLQDLFVDPAERARGIGERLIRAVAERARAVGSTSVYWQTHHTNERARRLYDRVARQSEFLIYRLALD